MDRRAFLRTLLAGAAGLTLDPERLLWVPGAKTIFIPEIVRPHNLITPEWIMREVARMLIENQKFAQDIYRQYDEQYKVGATVNVRLPARYRRTPCP